MSVNKVNSDGSLKRIAGGTLYADAPLGTILAFGGTTAPAGWMLCQGQALSRTTYAKLFAIIGTAFGTGDGSTTFNIPDLREATTKGAGLTGLSNNHMDADGLALGEFIDDRIQSHTHTYTSVHNGTNPNYGRADFSGSASEKYNFDGFTLTTSSPTGRTGTTTEVKAVGVNYIIKVMMVSLPLDIESQVDAKAGVGAAMIPLTNEDLNNVTEEGWYYSNGVDSLSNKPESGLYNNVIRMIKQGTTGRYIQEFICFNAGGDKWVREFVTPNYWTAWKKFMTSPEESYSTNEIDTGKTWIDGKKIYRKVVNLGAMPNKTIKVTAHGITNADRFVEIRGIAYVSNSNTHLPIPYVNSGANMADTLGMYVNATNVAISSPNYDFSAYSGYAILEYTKTT